MTIGTLTMIIGGVIYLIWSFFSVRDLCYGRFGKHTLTDLWINATFIGLAFSLLYLIHLLITNWNTVLWTH